MDIVLPLVFNILPLFILIGLGYISGRYLDVNLHSIARINIFILIPFMTFGAIVQMEFDPAYILLPVILGVVSVALALFVYKVSHFAFKDGCTNLLAIGTVNGNAIYFGLPVILYLFGPTWAGIYVVMNLGPSINNLSLAYFLAAHGRHNLKDSFKRLLTFPAIHATWLGFLVNFSGIMPESDLFLTYWKYTTGAMTILGMMMIGIGLAKLDKFEMNLKFLSGLFASKFLLWPLTTLGLILLDMHVTQLFKPEIHTMALIWASMPVMGNLVAYAAEYDLFPHKAAAGVLASSLFAIISIPAAYAIMQILQ